MPNVNWEALAGNLGDQAMEVLKGQLDGATDDLKKFGAAIGKDMVRAVRDDRPEVISELKEQMKLVVEMNRIELNNATWDFVGDSLLQLAKAARIGLLAAGVAI